LVLYANESGCTLAHCRFCFPDLPGGEVGCPDLPHLTRFHKVVQCLEGIRDWRIRVRAMELVQVNPVSTETPQRILNRATDVTRVCSLPLIIQLAAEFRGNDDPVPPPLQSLPQELLALTGGVAVSRIKEIDPGVQGRIHHARGRCCVN